MGRRRKRRSRKCVCGSDRPYPVCCRKYHETKAEADGPEELMRSRYAAYAFGKVDYLVETTDPEGEAWLGEEETEAAWRDSVSTFCQATNFNGLEIREVEVDGDEATLTFHADLDRNGFDTSFTETSRFVRKDGRWLYNAALESTDDLDVDDEEDEPEGADGEKDETDGSSA